MKAKKGIAIWLVVTLIVTFIAFAVSNITETDWGKVEVKSGSTLNECGDTLKYKAYIPKTASPENPAPLVIYAHGGSDGISVQTAYCIELSRRGYAVVTWDASGAVESENSRSKTSGAESIYQMVSKWDFVDTHNIITAGHSAGANLTMAIAQAHPEDVLLQMNIGFDMYGEPELGYGFNFVLLISEWDDSCIARTTNSGTISEVFQAKKLKDIFGISEDETLVVDQLYGDWSAKTGRKVVPVHCAHMYYPIDSETQTRFVETIDAVSPMPVKIAPSNHVYGFEHAASIVLYLCLASYIFLIATLLFRLKIFESLRLPELPEVGFKKNSWQWWLSIIILLILPVITFRLMVTTGLYTKLKWFITLKSKEYGLWMGWSLITAAAYLVFFFIFHFTWGKKHGGSLRAYGFCTNEKNNKFTFSYILKSLLYAVALMGSAYIIFFGMKYATQNNIHIIAFSINPIEPHRWFVYLFFFLFQIPYFVCGSLAARSVNMNNGNKDNVKGLIESVALGGVIGAVGLVALRVVLMICLYTMHRNVLFVDLYWLLGSNGICTMFLTFLVSNAVNCYVTNKTNSIYAGCLSALMWSTWIMVAGTRVVNYFL